MSFTHVLSNGASQCKQLGVLFCMSICCRQECELLIGVSVDVQGVGLDCW